MGIHVGIEKLRERLIVLMKEAIEGNTGCSDELKGVMQEWLDKMDDAEATKEIAGRLIPMMEACGCDVCKQILAMKHYLIKKSTWIFGGDGWAYDIGFGGLDHVIASGMNVNILVLDTEVYSNTGGQSSKSTPIGAVAKFASAGKRVRKKDLGAMAMTYGYVYVAQVAMGANHRRSTLNAIKEAEAYDGPSLDHRLRSVYQPRHQGRHDAQIAADRARKPSNAATGTCGASIRHCEVQGKNPFSLDSKEPDWSKFQRVPPRARYATLRCSSRSRTRPKSCSPLRKRTRSGATRLTSATPRWTTRIRSRRSSPNDDFIPAGARPKTTRPGLRFRRRKRSLRIPADRAPETDTSAGFPPIQPIPSSESVLRERILHPNHTAT